MLARSIADSDELGVYERSVRLTVDSSGPYSRVSVTSCVELATRVLNGPYSFHLIVVLYRVHLDTACMNNDDLS